MCIFVAKSNSALDITVKSLKMKQNRSTRACAPSAATLQTVQSHPVEVLSFIRGDNLATIATDGSRHVSQEIELVKEHSTLCAAISYLEAKGYVIDIDNFKSA